MKNIGGDTFNLAITAPFIPKAVKNVRKAFSTDVNAGKAVAKSFDIISYARLFISELQRKFSIRSHLAQIKRFEPTPLVSVMHSIAHSSHKKD